MDSRNSRQIDREVHREQTSRDELVERIARTIRQDGKMEPLKGLHFNCISSTTESVHSVSDPAFCVIAQGSKEICLGSERYLYDTSHYLLLTAELPLVGHVLEASKKRPYLSLRLELDPTLVGSVMVEAGEGAPQNPVDVKALSVGMLDADLLDAAVRLVRLLDSPAEAPFLAPLITREIVYRLWRGDQRDRLRHIATLGAYTPHIAKAIERLQQDFDHSLRIDSIARELGMSVSGFHH